MGYSAAWRAQVADIKRLEYRLMRQLGRASKDFRLIEPGDRILVGMSGGKDSYVMLDLLRKSQRRVPFDFEILAVNLDQGHPGFPVHLLEKWLVDEGYDYKLLAQDTYRIVKEKIPEGKTYCSLCSRLRRGILYSAAVVLGCTKIALGHHRDDVIETLMLNLLFSGQIKAMPPRLHSDDGRNVVIRPLIYCAEADIAEYAAHRAFPILPCDLCGSQSGLERQQIKQLLGRLNERNPKIKGNLFAALSNVRPSHLLDRNLAELAGVEAWTGIDEHVL
jgi:tRNA 2-thiocytidine biosynthesis protein TtcA